MVSFSRGAAAREVDLTTPGLLRAARALAQVDAVQLAEAANVGVITIKRIESGKAAGLRAATHASIAEALLALGVELLPSEAKRGPGLRLVERQDAASRPI